MKKSNSFLIFLFGVVWMAILFMAFIAAVKKSFKPPPQGAQDSATDLIREQRVKNNDVMEKQKRLMEERKQRLRDAQNR